MIPLALKEKTQQTFIYLFKVTIETLEKGVLHVQS